MLGSLPEALKKTNIAYTMVTNNETYPGVPLSYFHFCSTDDSNILCSHYYKFSAYCVLEFVFLNSWNHHKKCPGLLAGEKKMEPLPGRCGTSARSAVKQLFRALFY